MKSVGVLVSGHMIIGSISKTAMTKVEDVSHLADSKKQHLINYYWTVMKIKWNVATVYSSLCKKTGPILATLFDLVSNDSANMTKHVLTQTTLIIKYIMALVEELSLVVLLTPTIDRDIPVSKVRITESVNDIYLVISYLRSISV